jgi:hypothetical protein
MLNCWRGPIAVGLTHLRRGCCPEPDMPFCEPYQAWERAVSHFAPLPVPVEEFEYHAARGFRVDAVDVDEPRR